MMRWSRVLGITVSARSGRHAVVRGAGSIALLACLSLAGGVTPATGGRAACAAEVRTLSEIHAHAGATLPVASLTPAAVRLAYGFEAVPNRGRGQVIAVITAFHHPRIVADLRVFNSTFGLPPCPHSYRCLRRLFPAGEVPPVNRAWAVETALDVEWAHAIAPEARIFLVEARSNRIGDMFAAVAAAVRSGATVVSMSWGIPEWPGEQRFDRYFRSRGKNVSFVAAAGNSGSARMFYPAASPDVLSVGGTSLVLAGTGEYVGESAWSQGGGGLSRVEPVPLFQVGHHGQPYRGIPDVAYHADPLTGFAVYSSVSPYGPGWLQVGGTSAGAPQWAALTALVNAMRQDLGKSPLGNRSRLTLATAVYRAGTLTGASPSFHDITTGRNGAGESSLAVPGYDFATGLGSPVAGVLAPALAGQ